MITMLGFLVLIGTVVNNPILIVERAVTNLRERSMDVLGAVTEAVRIRLRPIMMSMITTVAGLSPLVFNPGGGHRALPWSGCYRPVRAPVFNPGDLDLHAGTVIPGAASGEPLRAGTLRCRGNANAAVERVAVTGVNNGRVPEDTLGLIERRTFVRALWRHSGLDPVSVGSFLSCGERLAVVVLVGGRLLVRSIRIHAVVGGR